MPSDAGRWGLPPGNLLVPTEPSQGGPTFATPTYWMTCHYKIDGQDMNWSFGAPTLSGLYELVESVKPGLFQRAPCDPDVIYADPYAARAEMLKTIETKRAFGG